MSARDALTNHFALGAALLDSGQREAAAEAFRKCLTLAPERAPACLDLGNALLRCGCLVDAAESFVACLRLDPACGTAYVSLAETLRGLALLDDAIVMAEQGALHLPGNARAKLCLANILHDRAEFSRAAGLYREVLRTMPDHPGVLGALANTLRALGDNDAAVEYFDRSLAIAPEDANIRLGRASALLAGGDFSRGWDDFEYRLHRLPARPPPRGAGDVWRGEDIAGKTILLLAEQGLGDTLQFVRFAALVARRGARVVLEAQAPLVRLLNGVEGVASCIAQGTPRPDADAHCPLLSLPRIFTTSLSEIPAEKPYLHADPAAVAEWRPRLPAAGLRVGLVWAGSPHATTASMRIMDRRRSLAPGDLAPLRGIAGVQFISLQSHGQRDLGPWMSVIDAFDPMGGVEDFAETAAIVANLDLVVSVDTAVAHLAGAMWRPIWLLSRFDGCWRWLRERDDSPWYPTMRIYRQTRPLDWAGAIARVRADLLSLVAEEGQAFKNANQLDGIALTSPPIP